MNHSKNALCLHRQTKEKTPSDGSSSAADMIAAAQSQCIIIDRQPAACSGACVGLWRGGKAGRHAAVIALLQRPLHMLVRAEELVAAAESERLVGDECWSL